jgi:FAD/FMN-containing dehydrogenase/Fe-S oxidoreductase
MASPINLKYKLDILSASLTGELFYDRMMRTLYATDASVYRELPLAVAFPKNTEDLKQLIHFAQKENTSLIPRTAGTSLAGQCVGDGIVVDTSRYLNRILEVNAEEGWVRVEPGVVRDELNHFLQPHGLFFGPNTSTANRAMIGGMVGNNSCGSYSIVYGSTREHTLEVKALLSDGSEATFKALDKRGFEEKCRAFGLEGELYRQVKRVLHRPAIQQEIRENFPKASIHRRNTGYALDSLLDSNRFTHGGEDFNFCKLICGSEGTLCLITEIKLHCDPLPPTKKGLMAVHFDTVNEALEAVVVTMAHQPRACELMDKIVLDCTKGNRMYRDYRFFVEGDPEGILIIEFGGETEEAIEQAFDKLEADLKAAGYGYHFPRIYGPRIKKVWDLRSAGLGLLANVPGDPKAVAVIEDTAVDVRELPAYIRDFTEMMDRYQQRAVYYAHAGAGELHLRPLLNLKDPEDRKAFRDIARETAELVKRYQGSLSGEHGDGRVRAEFIPMMVGEKVYRLFQDVKNTWDPGNIFNPGKIVDAPPMDESLRYGSGQETAQFDTMLDFSETGGILRMAEKCNGSGDCRKLPISGGTMCPSYMATRNEKDTTRARANILREFLTRSNKENRFDHKEIKEVMDLCLSCKGCLSECPSNVDVASLKAEFLHQYYQSHGVPFRSRLFANFARLNGLGSLMPGLTNLFLAGKGTSTLMKRVMGVAPERSLPKLQKTTLRKWVRKHQGELKVEGEVKGKLYFFIDEFTDLNDTQIGITALRLLHRLGYQAHFVKHHESGRAALSKGLLPKAKKHAEANVRAFAGKVNADIPLIGIEPSCILSFRDEYPRLVDASLQAQAQELSAHAFTIDEFLAREIKNGNVPAEAFTTESRKVKLHGHCHQKALSSVDSSVQLLSLPQNYEVEVIPSGCCGMAGSFGYEQEHYALSMQVGEMVLFPAVREAAEATLIAAPGTSCRHQIADGTGRGAQHPVEVLWEALKKS